MRHVEILDHKHTRTHAGQNQIHSNSGKIRDRLRNNYPEHNQIHLTMTKMIHLSNVKTDELSYSLTDGQSQLVFHKSILQFLLLSLNVYPNVVLFSTFFFLQIFALFMGLVYLKTDNNYIQEDIMNINGVIFLLIISYTYNNLFPVLNVSIFFNKSGYELMVLY